MNVMQLTQTFAQVVQQSEELPAVIRANALNATSVGNEPFDESYVEFLDVQIELAARGPEWTELLKRRRAALLLFCNQSLISGHITSAGRLYTVYIDPETKTVVHWEELSG